MRETVYVGYDNLIDLLLKSDGVAQDIRTTTKAAIVFNGYEYNSTNFADAFDWTTNGANGIIQLDLGSISGIETGRDKETELIIYDPNYTDGLVWGTFDLEIIEIEATEAT